MNPMLADNLFVWGAPERVWALPLGCLFIVALWWWRYAAQKRARLLVHALHEWAVMPGFAGWRITARAVLWSLALFSLGVALLQPQWGRKEVAVVQEGRDVLVALDISGSMQAQDIKPSRLTFVKLKIRKLLERLSFERVGLILFSGTAFVQCPLTSDYQTFLSFLDQVTTESISSGTTALGSAIAKAAEVFNRSQQRKNKLLLLVTDGEDFASDQEKLKALVQREAITIIAWGAGTPQGAPIPLYDKRGALTGHAKNKDGSLATTVLNEELLKQLSTAVGGQYERVTQDDGDIVRIGRLLDTFEREQFEERTISQYHDRYPFFVGLAWAFLILEWII